MGEDRDYEIALTTVERATMPTPDETRLLGPANASRMSNKLCLLLRKRLRQMLRVGLVLTIGIGLATTALTIWWLTSLNGLPDIGDPFDVAEFRAFSIPDDENAFLLFRRANEQLSPCPLSPGEERSAATVAWSNADPKLRAWVEANRPALELFQRGAARSDGISRRPGDPYSGRYSEDLGPHHLTLLALLEGGRLTERGDMAGAWDWYRAVLQATVHSARRAVMVERYFAGIHHRWLRTRLETWAADSRTTIPLLRRALTQAVESEPRPEWHAFSLKLEYLDWMRDLETTRHPDFNALQEERSYHLDDMELPSALIEYRYLLRRLLMREPERSRRAIRLLFANWLAEVETFVPRSRKPAVRATFFHANHSDSVRLYSVGPEAPAGAQSMSPHDLASWLVTGSDLKLILWNRLKPLMRPSEKSGHRRLVVELAGQLYLRERGVLPPSEDALVGRYLKCLPDDGSAEIGDESTPTVVDSGISDPPQPR
jgi:hypothetical protein